MANGEKWKGAISAVPRLPQFGLWNKQVIHINCSAFFVLVMQSTFNRTLLERKSGQNKGMSGREVVLFSSAFHSSSFLECLQNQEGDGQAEDPPHRANSSTLCGYGTQRPVPEAPPAGQFSVSRRKQRAWRATPAIWKSWLLFTSVCCSCYFFLSPKKPVVLSI